MAITGSRPESGVRIEIERPAHSVAPWEYRGRAVTPADAFDVRVVVSSDGDVRVELSGDAPPRLAERIRLLVRAAWKHAHDDGGDPPRSLFRWRADP